jgi:hypothetical protein
VLSDVAVALLRSQPRRPDVPWVFYNPKTLRPVNSIFNAWNTLRRKTGLADVRLHVSGANFVAKGLDRESV